MISLALCQTAKPYLYGRFLDTAGKSKNTDDVKEIVVIFFIITIIISIV